MRIEINLWFSEKTGNIFGNFNINDKEEVQNIDKLLSIQQFCEVAIKKKYMSENELSDFINTPDFDEDAKYAFTKEKTIVSWNTKKDFAKVRYLGQNYTLPCGVKKKIHKGMPDVYFRA